MKNILLAGVLLMSCGIYAQEVTRGQLMDLHYKANKAVQANNIPEALEIYKTILSVDANLPVPYLKIADIYAADKENKESLAAAVALYKKYLSLQSGDKNAAAITKKVAKLEPLASNEVNLAELLYIGQEDAQFIFATKTRSALKANSKEERVQQADNMQPIHTEEMMASSIQAVPQSTSSINTVNLQEGKTTVDVDIPLADTKNNKCFAVIIANENYRRESLVMFAKNDGETFKKYCIQTLGMPEKNVHYTDNATLNDIRAEINWISNVANAYEGDLNIIFYYAGHGIPDESSKTAYLLPVDGYGSDVATGYKLDDLYTKLGALPAKNITVFMDACFSGAQRSGDMLASARGVAIKTSQTKPAGNMVVFSASQGDETAYSYKEKGHGLFTYFLLEKLQETKGNVTLGELGNYIITNVKQQSIVVNNKNQTPMVIPSAKLSDKWQGVKLK